MHLSQKITLPCGSILINRIAKSAMSENMAVRGHLPGEAYVNLYRRWAQGGVGLCITGNIMVDRRHLGEHNNVVLENDKYLENFKHWAQSVTGTGTALWPQLNHPGKQIPKFLNKEPVAPSAIPFEPRMRAMFATPRALREDEIWEIIDRFATSAKLVQMSGFQGVQIHGAHGYLVSQFLSSRHNKRTDQWGGNLTNRMKFLIEVYQGMRKAVGPKFPIGVKINSADFQKGAFTHTEAIEVCRTISDLGMDLIEISGGSYEKPVMMLGQRESTKKREAYFLEYARDIKKVIKCPLMLTGGFRSQTAMELALSSGEVDLIGMARPLALNPDLPQRLLLESGVVAQVLPITSGFTFIDRLFPLEIIWYTQQLHRMGKNVLPNPNASVWSCILNSVVTIGPQMMRRMRAH